MDRPDERRVVIIVLRCVAVVTVLIGLILTTQTVVTVIGVRSASTDLPGGLNVSFKGAVGKAQGWSVVAQLSVCAWGLVLFALARPLADAIVSDVQAGPGRMTGNP